MPRPSTGRVEQLAPNRYRVRVVVGGRRLSQNITGTRSDAERLRRALLDGRAVAGAGQSLADFLDEWWSTAEERVSANTASSWRSALRLYIKPRLGEVPVATLSRRHLDHFVTALRKPAPDGAGLGASRARTILSCLSVAMSTAVLWGLRPDNPVVGLRVGDAEPSEVRSPTVEEIRALLAVAGDTDPEVGRMIVLAAMTGLRRAEIAGLRFADVDFERGVLRVRRSITKGRGGAQIAPTKTRASRQAIALSEGSLAVLAIQRDHQEREALGTGVGLEACFVFGWALTESLHPDTISARFRAVASAAGLGFDVEFRGLRHFTATQMLLAGVDPRTVQGRLRHGRASTTMNVYADFLAPADAHAARLLDRALDMPAWPSPPALPA